MDIIVIIYLFLLDTHEIELISYFVHRKLHEKYNWEVENL